MASLMVLRTRPEREGETSMQLPIKIGTFEASAISLGVAREPGGRPMTHDLLVSAIQKLGGSCKSVRIMSVQGTTFFAQLELADEKGDITYLDARPSDAIAVAVRAGVPIYAADSVLETAALPGFRAVEQDEIQHDLDEFHAFVENLSPDDFNARDEHDGK